MDDAFYSVDGILNRRAHRRNECSICVDFEDSLENVYRGILKNICPGGCYIETGEGPFKKNQKLSLTIPFQTRDGSVNVASRVAWSETNGFGVTFLQS